VSAHVMVFGSGNGDLPNRIRAVREGVVTTLVCRLEHLHRLVDPAEHARLLALSAEATLEECVGLARAVHEVHPVTHIATLGEHDQDRAAAVGVALGVHTHSPETVRLTNRKDQMRHRLHAAGVDDTPAELVDGVAALRQFALRSGYPIVVKPVGGMASFGVSVVRDDDEVEAAYHRAEADHPGVRSLGVLAERFLQGPEYSVEAYSEDREHVILAVTKKYKDPVTCVELGHVVPAPLDDATVTAIEKLVRDVLDALGVEFGATHTEVVLTESGPRIVETHVRMGGDEITDLVLGATGVDIIDCQIRQVVGERVLSGIRETLATPREPRAEAIWFAVPPASGTLVEVTGVETSSDGAAVTVTTPVGTEFAGLRSSYSRPAYARAHAPTADAAITEAKRALAQLSFVTRVPALPAGPETATT
jgi:biotin carboxylase